MIQICFACNDAMFDAVYLTALSILRRTKEPVHFYTLSANLTHLDPNNKLFTKKHELILKKMVKKYNKKSEFDVIDCTSLYMKHYGTFKLRERYISPYVLVRTLVAELKYLKGKILYLDTDIMVNKDIKLAYDFDLTNCEFMACRDVVLKHRFHKRYFNAGVLLINLEEVRKTKLFTKVFNYLHDNKPKYCEQDAINLSQVSAKEFPKNPYRFNYQQKKVKDDTVIKHFSSAIRLNPKHRGIKSWQIEKVQNLLKIHNWDEDYAIFLKEKEKWAK